MHEVRTSAIVPYSCDQLFDLVNDIESYPQFLNWCSQAHVLETDNDQGIECMSAQMMIRFGVIEQSFSTRNILDRPGRVVMTLEDGPFSSLDGVWQFSPLGDMGCRISLNLGFEFSSQLLGIAFRNGFTAVSKRLVRDFCNRADALYGQRKTAI